MGLVTKKYAAGLHSMCNKPYQYVLYSTVQTAAFVNTLLVSKVTKVREPEVLPSIH